MDRRRRTFRGIVEGFNGQMPAASKERPDNENIVDWLFIHRLKGVYHAEWKGLKGPPPDDEEFELKVLEELIDAGLAIPVPQIERKYLKVPAVKWTEVGMALGTDPRDSNMDVLYLNSGNYFAIIEYQAGEGVWFGEFWITDKEGFDTFREMGGLSVGSEDSFGHEANSHTVVPTEFSIPDLEAITGIKRETIKKYGKTAAKNWPERGGKGKNFTFDLPQAIRIVNAVAEGTKETPVKEKCLSWVKKIRS